MNFVVAGASGLVGTQVLLQLSEQKNITVTALVRKAELLAKLGIDAPHVSERVFDYENSSDVNALGKEIKCDIFICCLGSTLKAAGSREAFVRIEHDYPIRCLGALKKNSPDCCFAFVSSAGAGSNAGFYLRNKFSVEQTIQNSGLCYVIARPSILLGNRQEFRLGERVATSVMVALFGFLRPSGLTKIKAIAVLAPVSASDVARNMIRHALKRKNIIIEGDGCRN